MEQRDFKHQQWLWDENGIEVRDLRNSEIHRIGWNEIVRISGLGVRIPKGKRTVFAGNQAERKELGSALAAEWKLRSPCQWVAAKRRYVRLVRLLFGVIFPGVTLIVCVLPFLGLLGFAHYKGISKPEAIDPCVRGALMGTVFFLGWIGFYLVKVRRRLSQELREIEEVAARNNC